jgi:hypothetical protein
VAILGQVTQKNTSKEQSKSWTDMAGFLPVCFPLPTQAKTAHFLGGWVSLQMSSSLSSI